MPPLGKGLVFGLRKQNPIYASSSLFTDYLPSAFILLQGNRRIHITHTGNIDSFIIVFQPGMLRKFFCQSWHKAPIGVITLPEAGEQGLMHLWGRLTLAKSFTECCHLTEQYFLRRLKGIKARPDLVDVALSLLHSDVNLSIAAIASQLEYSTRHLRRRFAQELGIAPKDYQQLLRLSRAIRTLREGRHKNLAQLSLDSGFSDQAHLNKAFRRFLGKTPRAYLRGQVG